LVRGEPGIGKSQLARAAAKALGRAFVPHVVDARTESRDLLWHYDAVARLADAQLLGALKQTEFADGRGGEGAVQERIAIQRYLHPRALWWAFDWQDALAQSRVVGQVPPHQLDKGDPAKGCLVLIDEIDKAESDVPNGLLEALGAGSFTPTGKDAPVSATGEPPLVIITTNEERALPDAFIRRCLVLHLSLPAEREALTSHLVERARAHFPTADKTLLEEAAALLIRDRETAQRERWLPLPGQAEYLDLVRAVLSLAEDPAHRRLDPAALLEQVAGYVLEKHPDAFRRAMEREA
jgi:MoxR-like ATPase